MERELDIVVISDVHLGTYGCHAKELLNYLNSIKVGTLILNGDFIDMWQFRKHYFPREHMQIIQRVLKMAESGTKVYYITGNHDDPLRRYTDFSSGNIHLRDSLLFQLKGKTYWIFHGDIFDLFMKFSPIVYRLGGKSYDWLIRINRWINKVRFLLGMQRMSLAKRVKNSLSKAVKFSSEFEDLAIKLAADQGCDYVVCGHIHRPQMRTLDVDDQKITYLNSGDWVENLTALEYKWGRWSIYEYDETDYEFVNPRLNVPESEDLIEEQLYSTEQIFETIVKGIPKAKEVF